MKQRLKSVGIELFAPRQKDEDIRNREVVLNVLLVGTITILGLATLFITANYLRGLTFLAPRAVALTLVLVLVVGIYQLSRRGKYRLSAWLLVSVYFVLAASVGLVWSIALPSAILLYGLVVVMAGILLGPRYSLVGLGAVILLIVSTTLLGHMGMITHNLSWQDRGPSNIDDVLGLSFMLGIIAAVSWLFNYQVDRSLHRAHQAEAELTKQNETLEATVEERTRELQTAQLEKVAQMYRFAELGQLSTALMHDLANHLTSLTLNIESLEEKTRSKFLNQAKQNIHYIDDMVDKVRDQLNGRAKVRTFSVANEIDEMTKMLKHRGLTAGVDLKWRPPGDSKDLLCRGEPIRFRQMIANLICNGIDAYDEQRKPGERREVLVTASSKGPDIIVTVNDWGRGIQPKEVDKLFQPFHSTKDTGMGMGLFIVKQIADEHFLGSVSIDRSKKHTSFVVQLPRAMS